VSGVRYAVGSWLQVAGSWISCEIRSRLMGVRCEIRSRFLVVGSWMSCEIRSRFVDII
jgi:hypothetical protein